MQQLEAFFNHLTSNPQKLSNTLNLSAVANSLFDRFVGLALKGLK